MILLVLTVLVTVSGAHKLDMTYLPPASEKTTGSPGSLQPPLTDSFSQGEQQTQSDKQPGSETTFIGAIINQNGLMDHHNGDKVQNIIRLGPDGKAARAIDFQSLLRALMARIIEQLSKPASDPGTGPIAAALIASIANSNRPIGLGTIITFLNNYINDLENNEQTNNNEKTVIENTQIDASSNPLSTDLGTIDQPVWTVEYIFAQSGNLNNKYLPAYTSGKNAQPTYNGQSQNLATFGSNTNKPFGSFGGFANHPSTGAAQSGSPGFGSQPAYENQQQILPFPAKPQFGQILPSSFPTPQSVPPQFGLNQASLPPQQGQYNFQSATKPQFGQPGAFTSNNPSTQAFKQQAKPFDSQSTFPSFNQATQESQASSSATAKGPSATASAQASIGSEPEDQPDPAFKKS